MAQLQLPAGSRCGNLSALRPCWALPCRSLLCPATHCTALQKHIDDVPELKAEKQAMNRRTLKAMQVSG